MIADDSKPHDQNNQNFLAYELLKVITLQKYYIVPIWHLT